MFKTFAQAVHTKFVSMTNLFSAKVDDIETVYLSSFPEGTDPIHITRTTHDCACCKHFIRNIGNIDAMGDVDTIWNVDGLPYPYDVVAKKMHEHVSQLGRTYEPLWRELKTYGAEHQGGFNHFYATLPRSIPTSPVNSQRHIVLSGGLQQISREAVHRVIEMVAEGIVYRGEENKELLREFYTLRKMWDLIPVPKRNAFVMFHASRPSAVLKNSSIGMMLVNMSSGKSEDESLKIYESVTAPGNYRRPKPKASQRQIDEALAAIRARGVECLNTPREASLADVSVNNLLWTSAPDAELSFHGTEEPKPRAISLANFLSDIAPECVKIWTKLRNQQLSNLFVLYTDVAPEILKWGNKFTYSYVGDMTDAVKERVKQAGGDVSAAMVVSLAWDNRNDYDLRLTSPNGDVTFFGRRSTQYATLDVDANYTQPYINNPVENIAVRKVDSGVYQVSVSNYCQRDSSNPGFNLRVDIGGEVTHFRHNGGLRHAERVDCLKIVDGAFKPAIGLVASSPVGSEAWGIKTNEFVEVTAIMRSPNCWGDKPVGLTHTMFALKGIKPESRRWLYNEYLCHELAPHRNAIEVIAEKLVANRVEEPVGGVGFTTGDTLLVRVTGKNGRKADFEIGV